MLNVTKRRALCTPFFILLLSLTACSSGNYADSSKLKSHKIETNERIQELEARLLEVTSRLEELEYERFNSAPVENKINVEKIEPLKILPSVQTKPVMAPGLKMNDSSVVPKNILDKDKELALSLSSDSGDVFLKALELIEIGNFQDAIPLINEAYDLNYKKPNSAKILFWKGIIYEARRDNKKAISLYSQIINDFSNDVRSRESLLRQASIFIRIKEPELSKITYQKLVNDYPGSREAKRAKEKLKDL